MPARRRKRPAPPERATPRPGPAPREPVRTLDEYFRMRDEILELLAALKPVDPCRRSGK